MELHFQIFIQLKLVMGLYKRGPWGIPLKFEFSALSLASLYGLFSFAAAFSEITVKVKHLGYGVGAWLMILWITQLLASTKGACSVRSAEIPVPTRDGIYLLLILGISLGLGIFLFGLELTPSSMTGDPPRHFTRALGFLNENGAALWKPIYPLTVAGWLELTTQLNPVSSFTLFNVLVLGGVGALMYWMLCQFGPAIQGYQAFCAACVAVAGYPYFALQYGYFALNLAAMFFFAAMLAHLLLVRNRDLSTYMMSMIMGTGVALTHGYLLPRLLIMQSTIFIHTRFFHNHKPGCDSSSMKIIWLIAALSWYLILSMLSNGWISIRGLEGQFDTLKMRGLVNESFFSSIAPFLPLAAVSLFLRRDSEQIRILAYTVWLVLLYAVLLFLFGFFGLMLPYYVNRI